MKHLLLLALAALMTSATVLPVSALVNPFTEDYVSNNAGWLDSTNVSASWFPAGGVSGGGYISATGVINTTNGFGSVVFRGNDAANASGDAFVGNWLTGGVTLFTAYVRHNATTNLNFFARLDAGFGNAASSTRVSIAPNTWSQIVVPITNSVGTNGTEVFQSYGAFTTNPAGFNVIFTNIRNVQLALDQIQDPSILSGSSYTIDLDQPAIVPEPSTWALLGCGAALFSVISLCRRFRR